MAMTEDDVRAEVLDWFTSAWDPQRPLLEWRDQLVESGWAVPSWSTDWYGRGLPAWTDRIASQTIRHAGGVSVPLGVGFGLAAPTMYDHGSDDLKAKYLRRTLTGELAWCQLFSEPGAGSDLAGLQATATRDGDEWIVNGQKVWNTSADHADMAILVARTDWGVAKHAGITFFVLDMHQEGVEARPILQMNYHSSFNEVFMSDARVPHSNVVGEVGDGWRVARGTLAHERSFSTRRSIDFDDSQSGQCLDEAKAEAAEYLKTYEWYPQRKGRVDLVADQAQAQGLSQDLIARNEMMKLISFEKASGWTAGRARAARELGRPPGSEGSIGKLALSEIARDANAVHTSIAGSKALLKSGDDPIDETVAEVIVSTPAQSIAGGTDEIQRNILGENVLGLPKEPDPNKGKPFRDVGR